MCALHTLCVLIFFSLVLYLVPVFIFTFISILLTITPSSTCFSLNYLIIFPLSGLHWYLVTGWKRAFDSMWCSSRHWQILTKFFHSKDRIYKPLKSHNKIYAHNILYFSSFAQECVIFSSSEDFPFK